MTNGGATEIFHLSVSLRPRSDFCPNRIYFTDLIRMWTLHTASVRSDLCVSILLVCYPHWFLFYRLRPPNKHKQTPLMDPCFCPESLCLVIVRKWQKWRRQAGGGSGAGGAGWGGGWVQAGQRCPAGTFDNAMWHSNVQLMHLELTTVSQELHRAMSCFKEKTFDDPVQSSVFDVNSCKTKKSILKWQCEQYWDLLTKRSVMRRRHMKPVLMRFFSLHCSLALTLRLVSLWN